MGIIYRDLGRDNEALATFQSSADLYKKLAKGKEQARALHHIGMHLQ